MSMQFQKATKTQAKLRLALFGPSGAGKTYTALRLAKGMGGKVAVIDTERGSASKYADRFEFDVLELPARDLDTYVKGMRAASEYDILIIDSLSHGWKELLNEVDDLARRKYSGNTWSAWSEGTPKQQAFIDALLDFPGHVIATMRSKTEWVVEQDNKGRNAPKRIGTAPEQGKGIEYEFDMLMQLDVNHVATVEKDRTGKFQDKAFEPVTEELGTDLIAWLNEGEMVPKWPQELVDTVIQLTEIEAPDRARSFLANSGLGMDASPEIVQVFARGYQAVRDEGGTAADAFKAAKEDAANSNKEIQ